MFYNIFSDVPEELNIEYVKNFDFWLSTLPERKEKHITASAVCSQLGGMFYQAEFMLEFALKNGILSKHYLVRCPECGECIDILESGDQVADTLMNSAYCDECEKDVIISPDDIYEAYKVIKRPDSSNSEIEDAIKKKLSEKMLEKNVNFYNAGSLIKKKFLYSCFYSPNESAYDKFKEMRNKLEEDYGKNTTAQGNSLEELVLEIFKQIEFVNCSNKVHTETNQLDCTILANVATKFPSVFNYLSPMFLIECKNEKKAPGNTYTNKLIGIMEKNESKLGILFSRKKAAKTCDKTAYQHYLSKKYAPKQEIVICMDDIDLGYIIDKKVNLLEYLNFKICKLTTDSNNMSWEQFVDK